jgi:hypothetical protein
MAKYKSTVNLIVKNFSFKKGEEIDSGLLKDEDMKKKLLAHGQIKEVEDEESDGSETGNGDGEVMLTEAELNSLKKDELVKIAENYFNSDGMTKAEIIEGLLSIEEETE